MSGPVPRLRRGFAVSVLFAMVVALGRLVVPVAIQQILDRGVTDGGVDWTFVVTACVVAYLVICLLAVLDRVTLLRLLSTAEWVIYGLRTRAFGHVHDLSLAHHGETKRGVLVARVTSDIEMLARFAAHGAISWVINLTLILVSLVALAVYQWQLAAVVVAVLAPIVPIMRVVQIRQLQAYDGYRTTVSDTLSAISETIGGVQVLRSYGAVRKARRDLHGSIEQQYGAQLVARFYFAVMFPISGPLQRVCARRCRGSGCVVGAGMGDGSRHAGCGSVHHQPDRAAGRRDLRGAGPDPDRAGRVVQGAGSARPTGRRRRPGALRHAAGRCARRRGRQRHLRVRAGPPGAARPVADAARGGERGSGGRDRLGEVDARQVALPPRGSEHRRGTGGRCGPT
ncbi:MAG: ABC transporter transmembrane domain-containing protein [Microthrixaceae bacterium]|nr:ABC transporter transmembrane domain-containing protein [Microthrixaceae bacterium]